MIISSITIHTLTLSPELFPQIFPHLDAIQPALRPFLEALPRIARGDPPGTRLINGIDEFEIWNHGIFVKYLRNIPFQKRN